MAKQRVKGENKYKLSNGKGAILNIEDSLFNEEFLVVASLNAQNKDSQIHSALKISLSSIEKMFLTYIQKKESIIYNKENEKFDIREKEYFFELELSSKPISSVAKFDYSKLILELIKKEGLSILSWNEKAIELKDRVNFVNENMPKQLPNYKDDALLNSLDIWLEPYLNNIKTIKHLKALDLHTVLSAKLSWDEMKTLDNLAPAFVKVPSNSNIKIDYSNSKNPILAVKIQEVFGMSETPKILNNTIALQMHLLSPAQRPIQITNDIKNFWKNSYDEVRKELCGKYKKHYWPINPFDAIATNKTKKYM